MKWQAVAKSVIGTKHIKSETPCQDYSAYKVIDQESVIIGAVSDGMGSAKFSEIGSKLAVRTTLKYLHKVAVWRYKVDENTWKKHCEKLLIEVRNKLNIYAQKKEVNIDDLACTLIAFVATPQRLVAMQIGDGLIVVRSNDEDYELLFQPDKGEFLNETTPVTSSTAVGEMLFCVKSKAYDFICAATDGVEHLGLDKKTQKWKPYEKFFQGLEESIFSNNTLQHKEREVDDFLNDENLNKRTDDDKTLLLCAYSNFLEESKLHHDETKRYSHQTPNSDDNKPYSHPNQPDEKLKQFIASLKAEIATIPEAEDITPSVNLRRSCLEVIFKSSEPIQHFKDLVSQILEIISELTEQKTITIKELKVYNQNSLNSSYYTRVIIPIPRINLFRIAYLVSSILMLSLLAGVIFSIYRHKDPDVKTPSPESRPSRLSPEKTPLPEPIQSPPSL
jgi:hypothetical protein